MAKNKGIIKLRLQALSSAEYLKLTVTFESQSFTLKSFSESGSCSLSILHEKRAQMSLKDLVARLERLAFHGEVFRAYFSEYFLGFLEKIVSRLSRRKVTRFTRIRKSS